jgi:hypothetical protein
MWKQKGLIVRRMPVDYSFRSEGRVGVGFVALAFSVQG